MLNFIKGGGDYVILVFLVLYFGVYIVFPNNAFHGFLIRLSEKIILGGRQKW